MQRAERGQALPFVALVVLVAGLVCVGLARLGGAALAAERATNAADAAALAGARAGRAAATEVAAANGARLVSFEAAGRDTRVRVLVDGAQAVARARRAGSPAGPHAPARGQRRAVTGVVPELRAALAEAGRMLGRPVPVTSGFRTHADQQRLYAERSSNPFPVARPGLSRHELGLAVDVPVEFVPLLMSVAARIGLCHPFPQRDPVHFELCGAR